MFPPNNASSTPVGSPDPTQDPNAQQAGDGLHHFQLDQDESGGFNMMHTAPDGTQTPGGPYNSLDEAQPDMQQCMGEGQSDDSDPSSMESAPDMDDDSGSSDIAGSYAKAAKKSK